MPEALLEELRARFRMRTTAEWMGCLRGRVPCAPVNDVEEALQDEQVTAREMILELDHPEFGPLKQVRTAIRVTGQVDHRRNGPALGADTDDILQELLGCDEAAVAELRAEGVV